ncbi:MAG TPA: gamma-glutamyl-gamma-aminobutyrate hydrolase family protein [Acidimicrobiales bacterium]|nr:gamma-glutamyl-gamma-aminobutyrate hydrolase family protein [Acidimicrobiales bacterium]
MKARVGVTSIRSYDGPRPVEQVNLVYCEAVAGAGAIPFVLPVLDPLDAAAVVSGLDAVLLTGGGDVAAWCYGQEAAPEASGMDAARDAWELALVAAAGAGGLPILGICRGAQLLNVSAGGTLLQHLPAVSPELHRVTSHDREPVHAVVVDPASRLAGITGGGPIGVNSLHHQAVDRVGAGFRAVAWSPEGFVEAIEGRDAPCIGVQWHPELLTGRCEHARLFDWLVGRAVRRRDGVAEELLEAVA